MVDVVALVGLILGALSSVGGVFTYLHIKLKSNCCSCCSLEVYERTPPTSPSKYGSTDNTSKA